MPTANPPPPRVHEHLEALRAAGLDTQKFFEALVAIRDDATLPAAQREAIYRIVAVECHAWYLEALLGEPIDRVKAMTEARAIAEENAAAIKRTRPGEASAALIERDIGKGASREPRPTGGPSSGAPPDRGPRPPRKPVPPGTGGGEG